MDIVPKLARLYFLEKLPVALSYTQASVLLSMGLQRKDVSDIEVCSLTIVMLTILYEYIRVSYCKFFESFDKEKEKLCCFEVSWNWKWKGDLIGDLTNNSCLVIFINIIFLRTTLILFDSSNMVLLFPWCNTSVAMLVELINMYFCTCMNVSEILARTHFSEFSGSITSPTSSLNGSLQLILFQLPTYSAL